MEYLNAGKDKTEGYSIDSQLNKKRITY